jgi:glycosyltransferase involved in cell wall biosynthesis
MSTFWYGKYFRRIFAHFDNRITKTARKLFTVGETRLLATPLYNPIVAADHTPLPFASRSGFIFAGRLEAVKNVNVIIRNYAMLPSELKKMHNLNIVGTGSRESSLKKMVRELDQGDFVKFHGQVDSEVVISIIGRSIIFLMSSSYEGFPMAIAESLSSGTPVISTDVGDISSVVKNGYNGFLLPVGYTYSEFYARVRSIMDDFGTFSNNSLKSSSVFNAEENSKSLISACDEIMRLQGTDTE